MNQPRTFARLRALAGLVVALGALLASTATAQTSVNVITFGGADFLAEQTWRPVDFHMFSSPTDFSQTYQILPEPNHRFHPNLGVGPGDPHAGPYDTEMGDGIRALGIDEKQVFSTAEFNGDGHLGAGNGVFLAFMVIADPDNAPVGVTPDGVTPMIPNQLFGLSFDSVVLRNGVAFDHFAFDVPPLDGNLDPPFHVDGHSHFPLFVEEDAGFLPLGTPLEGHYEFRVLLRDQEGNGYSITSSWTVVAVPEPGTAVLMGTSLLALAGLVWRRRNGR